MLEKDGRSQEAVMETMRIMNGALDGHKEHVGVVSAIYKGWGIIIDHVNASLKATVFPSIGDQVKQATGQLESMQKEAKAAMDSWGAGPAVKADWDAAIKEQKHKLHDLICAVQFRRNGSRAQTVY